jgi:hypothetical protein
MEFLGLQESMKVAMKFADDLGDRLKVAIELNQSNGNVLGLKIGEIKSAGNPVPEELNNKMRDCTTIREHQIKYLEYLATFKTRAAQVLSAAMNPPKENLFNRGKIADIKKGGDLVQKMMDALADENFNQNLLGEDFLTITNPKLHEEAIKLMSARISGQPSRAVPKGWLQEGK